MSFHKFLIVRNAEVYLILQLISLVIVNHEVVLESIFFPLALQKDRVCKTDLIPDCADFS